MVKRRGNGNMEHGSWKSDTQRTKVVGRGDVSQETDRILHENCGIPQTLNQRVTLSRGGFSVNRTWVQQRFQGTRIARGDGQQLREHAYTRYGNGRVFDAAEDGKVKNRGSVVRFR